MKAQNLNHWTAREVPQFFFFFFSLEFGTHSPVVMSSPQCPYISQSIYPKFTNVLVCTDGSVSGELITWEHPHILTDTILTCVLMRIDVCIGTPRNTGTPVLLCFTDNALFSLNKCTFMAMLCQASTLAPFFLQHLLTSCLCVTFW